MPQKKAKRKLPACFTEFNGYTSTTAESHSRHREWRSNLPETPSAITPSKKNTGESGGYGIMLGGVGAATLVAALAILLVMIPACGVVGLCGLVLMVLFSFEYVLQIMVIVPIVIGFVALAVPFYCGGYSAAYVMNYVSNLAKNSSATFTAWMSALAMVGAVFLCTGAWFFVVSPILVGREIIPDPFFAGFFALLTLVIGGIYGVTVAVKASSAYDGSVAPRCETCNKNLTTDTIRGIGMKELMPLALAMKARNFPLIERVMQRPAGDWGELNLATCPQCKSGALELMVNFEAVHQNNPETPEIEDRWRAGSMAVDRTESQTLRSQAATA